MTSFGARSACYGYKLHASPYPAHTCISVNEEVVHGIPGDRVLAEGDVISIDCGAIVDGWHGDAAITVAIGAVSAEAEELMRVTEESLWRGLAAARLGGRVGDISHAIESYVGGQGDTMLGATGALWLMGGALFSRQSIAGAQIPSCVVRPEQTEGPYFVDERLHRSDIRSDPTDGRIKAGTPLILILQVMRLNRSGCVRRPTFLRSGLVTSSRWRFSATHRVSSCAVARSSSRLSSLAILTMSGWFDSTTFPSCPAGPTASAERWRRWGRSPTSFRSSVKTASLRRSV